MAPKTDKEKHPDNYFDSPVGHIRDLIKIHETQDMPKEGMFISLNGFPFLAKPEVEISIPRPVRLMLDTLIRTEILRVEIPGTNQYEVHERNIRRIPYTLIREDVDKDGKPMVDPAVAAAMAATNPPPDGEKEVSFP